MQAHHYSARLAPKKANLVAQMVRGMPVPTAMELLRKTHKKAARLLEDVLRSAIANAHIGSAKLDTLQVIGALKLQPS